MKPKIYIKFLLSYVFFGIAAILVLCTFTQRSITNYLEKHEAQSMQQTLQIQRCLWKIFRYEWKVSAVIFPLKSGW